VLKKWSHRKDSIEWNRKVQVSAKALIPQQSVGLHQKTLGELFKASPPCRKLAGKGDACKKEKSGRLSASEGVRSAVPKRRILSESLKRKHLKTPIEKRSGKKKNTHEGSELQRSPK